MYSNALGYLGGVSWAIMCARICQAFPNAIVSDLLYKFFKFFYFWSKPREQLTASA